ncbi:capsid assembly scaffolding protein Gp46 family protein [Lactococcus petauri]|uniref:capsid assembly scaffolding protein Gp46 family protein n=1 Tax=Lactococcus petauri TaxID=1940789 RepID=UPI0031FF3A37
MEQKTLLPLDLQLFADEIDVDETSETENNQNENVTESDDQDQETNSVDPEKVIEKLQKRIGKEQADKNETKTQLEQALARIEELEKGSKKSIKEKSDEEKAADLQKEKDDEIAALKAQIKLSNITSEADEVLKESGIALKAEELALLVDVDEEKTYSNVKTFLGLLENQRIQWEKERNTGVTPKKVPSGTSNKVTKESFDRMTAFERAELFKNDPQTFKHITGGNK